jgi:hypothetical protein
MPVSHSKAFWDAYLELSHRENVQLWLDDTASKCNQCGVDTVIPQVDLIWQQKVWDANKQVWFYPERVVSTMCQVCHDEYANLLRNDESEQYWTAIEYAYQAMRRERGGSNG